ncbi:MAG: hypothetical protein WCO86_19525 [Planctomycetota bacterium]
MSPSRTEYSGMTKTIEKVGNAHGIVFDAALLSSVGLKPGDEVNVEAHPGGMITITPVNRTVIDATTAGLTARRLIEKNDQLFRRLS